MTNAEGMSYETASLVRSAIANADWSDYANVDRIGDRRRAICDMTDRAYTSYSGLAILRKSAARIVGWDVPESVDAQAAILVDKGWTWTDCQRACS